jgi:phosphonate transport system substrate-binding protein
MNGRRSTLLALGALAAVVALPCAAEGARTYRFSPVNQYGIALTAEYWNPIISYVSAKSGVNLQLKIGRTSADTTSYVLAQEVEFVFSNHLFSPERDKLGFRVFGRRDMPPIHGQLVVPADSPITDVAQLAGQDVGFPGPEAFVSYKVPYAYLLSKGIAINVIFGGNTDAALVQLFSGKVKAVGGNSQLIAGYAARERRKYRILWTSEPFHELALMASAKVPEADRTAVAAAFIGMAGEPEGQRILHAASRAVGLADDTRFIASDGSEYAPYRRFYETAPVKLR